MSVHPLLPSWKTARCGVGQGATKQAFLYALNRETGEEVWRSKVYRPAYGSPVALKFKGKTYIATLKTDGLVILDSKNGKIYGGARCLCLNIIACNA